MNENGGSPQRVSLHDVLKAVPAESETETRMMDCIEQQEHDVEQGEHILTGVPDDGIHVFAQKTDSARTTATDTESSIGEELFHLTNKMKQEDVKKKPRTWALLATLAS
jgi:hypothetical protein